MEVHHGAHDRRFSSAWSNSHGTWRWRCGPPAQGQISEAWREAPTFKLTGSTGLGQDRLTEAGRTRGKDLIEQFVR
jgi:hypothetical protein